MSKLGGSVGLIAGLMAGTVFGVGFGLLLVAPRPGSALHRGTVAHRPRPGPRVRDPLTEADLEREEMIDALLHPGRSCHDELGRTVDGNVRQPAGRSSPREQGAGPIDMTNIDE